jgi:putative NADPH-quinone reductase
LKRIALIQGHPDAAGGHFCHALAGAYERSATKAGHAVNEARQDWLAKLAVLGRKAG